MLQRIDLADRVAIAPAPRLRVTGFAGDTIVRDALERARRRPPASSRAGAATITKRIPVAAGLGGGSSDAATALRLANETLDEPLPADELHALAATLGADVPFFLARRPAARPRRRLDARAARPAAGLLGRARAPARRRQGVDGGRLRRASTSATAAPAARSGARALDAALAAVRRPRDLAALPPNDLASSPLADELRALGAFRADVSGAGPAVYGLFHHRRRRRRRGARSAAPARTWLTVPVWYG